MVASKVGVVRDDVVRGAGVERADGDDHRVEDVELAGHQRLQRRRPSRRPPGSGPCRCAAASRGRRRRAPSRASSSAAAMTVPGAGDERPRGSQSRQSRAGRSAPTTRGPAASSTPSLDHVPGAVVALLAGLEHEDHVAGELGRACARAAGPRRPASRCAGRGRRRASRRRSSRRSPGRCAPSPAARPCRRAAAPPAAAAVGRRAARRSPRSAPRPVVISSGRPSSAASTCSWVRGRSRPISGMRCRSRRRRTRSSWRPLASSV